MLRLSMGVDLEATVEPEEEEPEEKEEEEKEGEEVEAEGDKDEEKTEESTDEAAAEATGSEEETKTEEKEDEVEVKSCLHLFCITELTIVLRELFTSYPHYGKTNSSEISSLLCSRIFS